MEKEKRKRKRKLELVTYALPEKILNTTTHAISAVLMVFAWYVLFKRSETFMMQLANTIYSLCIFIMFFNSALYHGVPSSKFSYVMRAIDHSSIFLAIAGTYTPILLYGIDNTYSYIGLAFIWFAAIVGIILKIIAFSTGHVTKSEKPALIMYLIMGWVSVFFIPSMIRSLPWQVIGLILLGGLFYTVGVYFYKQHKIKMNHFIWHLFIMGGAFSHYFAIFLMTRG